MKIETTTKTYDIDGIEFVICRSEDDWTVIAGTDDTIQLEKDYTDETIPKRYEVLFELEENEKLADNIICVEIEHNIFNF